MKKLYDLLEIEENATKEEIISSYKRLAKKYHPDINKNQHENEKFKEITNAYKIIIKNYKQQKQNLENNKKYIKIIKIKLEDAFFGKNIQLDIKNNECEKCNGTGYIKTMPYLCPKCNGLGYFEQKTNTLLFIKIKCNFCDGIGKTNKTECFICDGTGKTEIGDKKINIDIPEGTLNNDIININKNLDIVINIEKHEKFEIINRIDLKMILNINFWDAILGCKKQIKTIDNKKINIDIQKYTQNGKILRIKNYGLNINETKTRGNLLIYINIIYPENLNEKSLELLKEIKEINNV